MDNVVKLQNEVEEKVSLSNAGNVAAVAVFASVVIVSVLCLFVYLSDMQILLGTLFQ
jgi:hypothetical protein